MIMKDLLKNMGYEVVITNEYEALREVRELSPNILISNLIMKDTSGNVLIEKIKLLYPDVRCYLSSNNPIKLEDYKKNKVDDVVQTPADRDVLENLLARSITRNTEIKKDSAFQSRASSDEILQRLMSKKRELNTIQASEKSNPSKRMAFCPYCGEKLQSDSKFAFCPFCGGKL